MHNIRNIIIFLEISENSRLILEIEILYVILIPI